MANKKPKAQLRSILHLVPHVRNRGNGIVNVAVDLAILQARAGYQVTVAAETGDYRPLLESAGVTFVEFPHPKNARALLATPFRFRRLVKAVRPDIIHAHVLTGTLLGASLRFGTPYRLVASLHSENRKLSILMGVADHIISVSDASALKLAARGVKKTKISVIENAPLNTPRAVAANGNAPPDLSRPSITTIAGMYYRKGIDVLLDAFERVHERVPNANLYIIGNGPDRDDFVRRAEGLRARPQIHFLGFVPDPQPFLKSTDVFVLASRRDPFPLALIEARAAGCAVVASDVDGIPEALDGGRRGLLVPPDRPAELAAALVSLLADERALAVWKSAASEELDRFAVERLHSETLSVYAHVSGGGGA
jgi:glycosyltransferase involved in cell wall biosynthesis